MRKKKRTTMFDNIQMERKEQQKLQKEMNKQRKKQLLEANSVEDRNIKRLEKQLKLNKRKNKSIPKSFAEEGLDYILEVCDSEKIRDVINIEKELYNSDGEFDEDFALMTNQTKRKSKKKVEKPVSSESEFDEEIASEHNSNDDDADELLESYEGDDEDKLLEHDEIQSEDYDSDSDSSANHSNQSKKNKRKKKILISNLSKKQKNDVENKNESDREIESNSDVVNENSDEGDDNKSGTWEDIYGRIRAKDGSVITNNSDKYVPPAMRQEMQVDSSNSKERMQKLNRLKKQIKGLLNRLAEANMHSISRQIEELYMRNSRNDMNDTITNIVLESVVSHVMMPERLLIEHVVLITVLHANVGTEVGAHFLHSVVKQFDTLFDRKSEVENKELDNNVRIIAQLYNFKVFHSKLLYEILSKLSHKFDEKCIECILLILKDVGFSLRKDDPLALKGLILKLQNQASNVNSESIDNLRVKFMLDILLAIKNNNMNKIPNYDTSYAEHLKKLQKNFIRKGNYVTQLNISLEDLLKADERGRWWIVGSAWSGSNDNKPVENKPMDTEGYSQKLLDLAKKQRMNTDTRRNIFCILMSAEDYIDAFEKLLRLGLKNQQEQEIINVIIHCCLQEKVFNPYYAVLTQRFCECDRKYQMMMKCSTWDKVKALTNCSASQISNLAKLLTHLFVEKGLPISTLKVLQFSELDKITLRFMRQILLGILLHKDAEACVAVFERVAQAEKLKMFRESLRLFIHHFLLKNLNKGNVPEEQTNLLKSRCDIVEKMLTAYDKRTRF